MKNYLSSCICAFIVFLCFPTRGMAKSELFDPSGSIKSLNNVIELKPDSAYSYSYRERARAKTGDYSGALKNHTTIELAEKAINSSYQSDLGNDDAKDIMEITHTKPPVIEDIIEAYHSLQELNKKAIANINFELIEKQPVLGSMRPKFILRGNGGGLWLFKIRERSEVDKAVAISSLAQLLGLNVPESYFITLPVNGHILEGHIQKFFTSSKNLKGVTPNSLSEKQLEQIQKQHVFDWLIGNYGATNVNFLMLHETGEIVGIDKYDGSLRKFPVIDKTKLEHFLMSYFTYYYFFWSAYINGQIDVDFEKTFEVVDLIQEFDDDIFSEIFSVCGSDIVDELLLRKKVIEQKFEYFCSKNVFMRGDVFRRSPEKTNGHFPRSVLKNLKDKILQKEVWLEKILSNKTGEQKNIEIIISPEAYSFIVRNVLRPLKEVGFGKIVSELKTMRSKAVSIYEKLAISLYIAQIRRVNVTDMMGSMEKVTRHPKDVLPEGIARYLKNHKKTWQDDQNINNGNAFDKEDNYLLELAHKLANREKQTF